MSREMKYVNAIRRKLVTVRISYSLLRKGGMRGFRAVVACEEGIVAVLE